MVLVLSSKPPLIILCLPLSPGLLPSSTVPSPKQSRPSPDLSSLHPPSSADKRDIASSLLVSIFFSSQPTGSHHRPLPPTGVKTVQQHAHRAINAIHTVSRRRAGDVRQSSISFFTKLSQSYDLRSRFSKLIQTISPLNVQITCLQCWLKIAHNNFFIPFFYILFHPSIFNCLKNKQYHHFILG